MDANHPHPHTVGRGEGVTAEDLLAEVKRHWDHWAGHLGISPNWWIDFKIDTTLSNRLEMHFNSGGYHRAVCAISPDAKSVEATWTPLSRSVLHEAFHIFMKPMVDAYLLILHKDATVGLGEAEEGVVDDLTAAFWRLHEQTGCAS